MKPLTTILVIACVLLAGALVFHYMSAREELNTAMTELATSSNLVVETSAKLAEQEKMTKFVQAKLDTNITELSTASNEIARGNSQLAAIQTELKGVQADVKTVKAEAEAKGVRITQLEAEKDEMSKKLTDLAGQINTLEGQITETKRKLAAAEGDRAYLTKELARLQTDKAELLKQFNDLAALRAQIILLRNEAAINQRLSWASQGVYASAARKGAEALLIKPTPAVKPDPGLDVELEQNAGVLIVPKSAAPTPQPQSP